MAMSKLRSRVREQYTDRRLQVKEGAPMNTNMEAVRIMFRRYRESVNAELKSMCRCSVYPRIASMGVTTVSKVLFTHP